MIQILCADFVILLDLALKFKYFKILKFYFIILFYNFISVQNVRLEFFGRYNNKQPLLFEEYKQELDTNTRYSPYTSTSLRFPSTHRNNVSY